MTQRGKYLIGVDVGTGSARAGVFDLAGRMLGSAKQDITIWREPGSIVEQSGNQIWQAVCASVKGAVAQAAIAPEDVAGIGFDATCSLVVLDGDGAPLAVGPSNDPERNIIVWMDHRAIAQAERINAQGHDVLKYVGGVISPEMETPKILWLAEEKPETFAKAGHFFDLADYLGWRATGSLARSTCTVTCKWTYLAHEGRWDDSYFRQIGLGALADEGFARIGTEIVAPGTPLGAGLTAAAAADLGLVAGIAVGAGLIDAHAGGVGTVGAEGAPTDSLAYVFGTSSCTMTTTKDPVFVPGVWGPYYQAMVPDMWLNEGGQSAAGAAIDQLIAFHPATTEAASAAAKAGQPLPVWLADRALEKAKAADAIALAGEIHVVPEFLGNRAPFADPHARAVIAGLGMERDLDSLIALYVAGVASIGYGLRQIIETQAANGAVVKQIVISGGAGAHDLTRQILADATGLPLVATEAEEPVLLGSAILGAVASGKNDSMTQAMAAMTRTEKTYLPEPQAVARHDARFAAFRKLQDCVRTLRAAS
ncbi:FGGY-family carbohydrate kinase [Paracoccus aminophilus]|uniref:Ribulokinase n=1 Tax=Paracoccus aminophilus JCM 7686 TaxID=1367847 RepID=S5Y1C1_PARAH|nr:FGGY-family carbohydrate kinase [Paracoccus aminophilus]AGT11287.1 ribulokinase [Paracoccus aminophilus JCM 7686]